MTLPATQDTDGLAAGPVRVDLLYEPSGRKVRVPAGVTLFDAASWNGIAIDSTCGGHGTWTLHFLQVPWPPQVESIAMPFQLAASNRVTPAGTRTRRPLGS